jgi:cyclophilin family peptidyl-prolyl cis-trans isomerase
MPFFRILPAACTCLFALSAAAQTQPTAVIDTTAGRITCILFPHERPRTTAAFLALAEGSKPWIAPDGSVVRGKPFYDGTRIVPSSAGISAGTRSTPSQTAAGPFFPPETTPPLRFDRPGLLAMTTSKANEGPSRFLITDHANTELDGHAVVFGQCDAASIPLVAKLRHSLQASDNHPATALAINHIALVPPGQPLPSPVPNVPAEAILPPQSAAPLPPLSGPEPSGPVAVLETSVGKLSCRLFSKQSPLATSTFLSLADGTHPWTDPTTHTVQRHHRFYDGMPIDRVLPDYYLQFGDITGDISGLTDIGFQFKNENTPGLTFDRPGRLAFGNGGPDTNSSELFFTLNPMHALDGGYTIIGHLPRDASNRPLTPVVIRRIAVLP